MSTRRKTNKNKKNSPSKKTVNQIRQYVKLAFKGDKKALAALEEIYSKGESYKRAVKIVIDQYRRIKKKGRYSKVNYKGLAGRRPYR